MAAGYHDFTAGEVLTAANLEDYCQNQAVMRFADSATRDTALSTVKTEGMVSHQLDSNAHTVYSGSAWSTVGPLYGAWTTWTPTITQSGSVTVTNTSSTYIRVGRLVIARFSLAVTGTGTGANAVVIDTPVTPTTNGTGVIIGNGMIFDSSASLLYRGLAFLPPSTSTVRLLGTNSTANAYLGADTFTAALASGDTIVGELIYEAASDA